MITIRPFCPVPEVTMTTQNLAVGTAAASVNLPTPIGTYTVRIVVVGSQTVFMKMINAKNPGTASLANSIPILAGTVETFLVDNSTASLSFIASAVGSTVYVTIGESA